MAGVAGSTQSAKQTMNAYKKQLSLSPNPFTVSSKELTRGHLRTSAGAKSKGAQQKDPKRSSRKTTARSGARNANALKTSTLNESSKSNSLQRGQQSGRGHDQQIQQPVSYFSSSLVDHLSFILIAKLNNNPIWRRQPHLAHADDAYAAQ